MDNQFNYQQEFTRKTLEYLGSKFPLSDEDKIKWTKEYSLYIISECNDLLNQLNWKTHWSNNNQLIRDNVGIEIIDIQKFVWGLCQIWGISMNEFENYFAMKSYEVESKINQEHSLRDLEDAEKVCIIDIDGVLTPYPEGFLRWAKETYNISLDKKDVINWEKYKDLYRKSGAKSNLECIESSKISLSYLHSLGYKVVLLTNRPCSMYKRIYYDTISWLAKNNIYYDYIFWSSDKKILSITDKCKNIKFVVDDNLDTIKQFRNAGIKTYHYNKNKMSLLEIEELNEG